MAIYGKVLTASALVALGVAFSCSSSGDDDDSGSGTGGSPNNGEFRDTNGDGQLDPLSVTDFGEGAIPITDAQIDELRNGACSGWNAEPEPLGATLFMVLDASSSMDATAAGTGQQSKWEATRDALVDTVGLLSDDTQLGMLAYPNRVIEGEPGPSSNCVNVNALISIELLGANGHRQTMIDGLNAVETETCTPTHDALLVALQDYAASQAVGQKYIMLMTDGQPTLTQGCEPGNCDVIDGAEDEVIAEIANAYDNLGIKTFVLGSPGSEEHMQTGLDNRWWLSQAAEVGGTAKANCSHDAEPYCHFDMTTSDDFTVSLREALGTIAGQVVSCDYGIAEPPQGETVDINAINMVIWPDGADPIQILKSPTTECTQGWYWDAENQLVHLCPESCALAQSDPRLELELMFGCESVIMVPE